MAYLEQLQCWSVTSEGGLLERKQHRYKEGRRGSVSCSEDGVADGARKKSTVPRGWFCASTELDEMSFVASTDNRFGAQTVLSYPKCRSSQHFDYDLLRYFFALSSRTCE